MDINSMLSHIENRAVSAMRNISPTNGSIHDYRNILNEVDKAMRAVNNAYIACARADRALQEIAEQQ